MFNIRGPIAMSGLGRAESGEMNSDVLGTLKVESAI